MIKLISDLSLFCFLEIITAMQTSKRFSLAIILLIVIVGSFSVGFFSGSTSRSGNSLPASIINTAGDAPAGADFSTFWKAWSILDEKFAGTSTPPQDQIWGAIKGLTNSLNDPYTVFFPPEESKIFNDEISGNFEGGSPHNPLTKSIRKRNSRKS